MTKALGREPSPQAQDWDKFIALTKSALEASPGAETVTLAIPARLLLRIVSGSAAASAAPRPKEPKK